eukprot:TRINITY_DN41889_c0_g1_i1.p1 TRINITY_DN41889_c0_g1~~TRINITY_DN41889_c0_g1_i1.p1  ORF type:complete len:362 (+),score=55.92 TRINITY_DN41889_c0_g1_i1:55-1140(+)
MAGGHAAMPSACGEAEGDTFAVTIRLLSGEPIAGLDELRVRGNAKVDVLLSALAGASGTRHWQLFFEGYELHTDEPIAQHGMADGATVNAVATRKGGIEQAVWRSLTAMRGDNLPTIVEQLALLDLDNATELELVISFIWEWIFDDPCHLEAYVDLFTALRMCFPEFLPENAHEKPLNFTRVLLGKCQLEFESILLSCEHTQEEKELTEADKLETLSAALHKRKERALIVVKIIGQLFVQKMLMVKVIGQIMHDLIGVRVPGENPTEHFVRLSCEMLLIAGPTLDSTPHGKNLQDAIFARLRDLQRLAGHDGQNVYSKGIRLKILGLVNLRRVQWLHKGKESKVSEDSTACKCKGYDARNW